MLQGPSTGEPKTLKEILKDRKDLIQEAAKPVKLSKVVFGSIVSDQKDSDQKQVFKVNDDVPEPKVLTLVCWNVQTFTEGKAETNPVVSFVMNSVLEALKADLCIMLETRENPAVNLAAVEEMKEDIQIEKFEEEKDDDDDDEDDDPETSDELKRRVEDLAAQPITYETLASETTGKSFQPPARLYPYEKGAKPLWNSRRFLKEFESLKWTRELEQLNLYYEVFKSKTAKNPLSKEELGQCKTDKGIELRLQRCGNCKQHLGLGACAKCRAVGPGSTSLENLRHSLDTLTFGFAGRVELETYSVLIKPQEEDWNPPGMVLLKDKEAAVLRGFCTLLSVGKKGKDLGFSNKESAFYGRSPFLITLGIQLPGEDEPRPVPVVAFHAPFGSSTKEGFEARRDALLEVLKGGLLGDLKGKAFAEVEMAILLGDLNLDRLQSAKTNEGKSGIAAYEELEKQGFQEQIVKTASSLKSVYNNSRQKKKKNSKYDGASWIQIEAEKTSDLTSSAYDNVFVKGGMKTRSAVVDVIAWLAEKIEDESIEQAEKIATEEWKKYASLKPLQRAFFLYRTFVSDHLPVLVDIAVAPANIEARQQLKKELSIYATIKQKLTWKRLLFLEKVPFARSYVLDDDGVMLVVGLFEEIEEEESSFQITLSDDKGNPHKLVHESKEEPSWLEELKSLRQGTPVLALAAKKDAYVQFQVLTREALKEPKKSTIAYKNKLMAVFGVVEAASRYLVLSVAGDTVRLHTRRRFRKKDQVVLIVQDPSFEVI